MSNVLPFRRPDPKFHCKKLQEAFDRIKPKLDAWKAYMDSLSPEERVRVIEKIKSENEKKKVIKTTRPVLE